jgi:hypothetical protein
MKTACTLAYYSENILSLVQFGADITEGSNLCSHGCLGIPHQVTSTHRLKVGSDEGGSRVLAHPNPQTQQGRQY